MEGDDALLGIDEKGKELLVLSSAVTIPILMNEIDLNTCNGCVISLGQRSDANALDIVRTTRRMITLLSAKMTTTVRLTFTVMLMNMCGLRSISLTIA